MNRNWDTIRDVLIATESLEQDETLSLRDFDSGRASEISYHVELLAESGLLNVTLKKRIGKGPKDFFIRRLTWAGHEFLDAIRDESVWSKTKSKIMSKGGSMTFDLVKDVAISIIKSALGL